MKKSEINAAFQEGENALYLLIQLICPECNKLVRVSFLADSKSMKVTR